MNIDVGTTSPELDIAFPVAERILIGELRAPIGRVFGADREEVTPESAVSGAWHVAIAIAHTVFAIEHSKNYWSETVIKRQPTTRRLPEDQIRLQLRIGLCCK